MKALKSVAMLKKLSLRVRGNGIEDCTSLPGVGAFLIVRTRPTQESNSSPFNFKTAEAVDCVRENPKMCCLYAQFCKASGAEKASWDADSSLHLSVNGQRVSFWA